MTSATRLSAKAGATTTLKNTTAKKANCTFRCISPSRRIRPSYYNLLCSESEKHHRYDVASSGSWHKAAPVWRLRMPALGALWDMAFKRGHFRFPHKAD